MTQFFVERLTEMASAEVHGERVNFLLMNVLATIVAISGCVSRETVISEVLHKVIIKH